MEQIKTADVDDKDVLEGLFKENKEILDFLSSGLPSKGNNQTPMRSQETLGEISEEKDDEESGESKISQKTKSRSHCDRVIHICFSKCGFLIRSIRAVRQKSPRKASTFNSFT
jgi:hypothetical protein